jgi:tetratricopeptide (TPR) repeat protein
MTSGVDPNRYSARLAEASALRNAGRIPEAVKAYRDVLAIEPDLPDSWYNLAWLLRRKGEPAQALKAYDEALSRSVAGPEEVWLNKGVIQADDLLNPEAAIAAYKEALRLNPVYVPALLNLGNTHEDLGDRAAAIACYGKILELAPQEVEPLARIGNLSKPQSRDDDIVQKVEAACRRSDLTPEARASLEFALGKLLDQLGAYDDAFAAYARANRLSEAARPAGFPSFEAGRHDATVQSLMGLPAPTQTNLPASPIRPVFILGQFRSGSTLLEQILSAHSQVEALGELPLLASVGARYFSPYPSALAAASPTQIAEARDAYLSGLEQRRPGLSGVVTDKRPDNFYHIGLILRLFPEAKILHTVRDARDVCLSTWFTHLDHQQLHATDLASIGRQYRAYERLMAHWKGLAPERILDVSYDVLVSDPETEIRRVLDYLDLPFEAACLDFHTSAAPVKTASVWQVREPLYTRSSGRWRNYQSHLGPLLEALNGETR